MNLQIYKITSLHIYKFTNLQNYELQIYKFTKFKWQSVSHRNNAPNELANTLNLKPWTPNVQIQKITNLQIYKSTNYKCTNLQI